MFYTNGSYMDRTSDLILCFSYVYFVSDEENITWLMAYKCSCYIHSNALTDCIVTYNIVQVLHRMIQCIIYTCTI